MESRVWSALLELESRDFVCDWFNRIHGKNLNARRAKEITASAKQGREYFNNASSSSIAVRPLLTFYGVASLCRSLTLLHSRDAGEEGLKRGHGLETISWDKVLSGDMSKALSSINNLSVRICNGLFLDLSVFTNKKSNTLIYDKYLQLPYNDREIIGETITLSDILDRLPDISVFSSFKNLQSLIRISDFAYSKDTGAKFTLDGLPNHPVCLEYSKIGYSIFQKHDLYDKTAIITTLEIEHSKFEDNLPQILDTRTIKTQGGYPSPYLTKRFSPDLILSQISITYAISFILGMLARYFPTHWYALIEGGKGDSIWPAINSAQTYVEIALPELILDVINSSLLLLED